MAAVSSSSNLSGLAYALVQHGRLPNADAEAIQAQANTEKNSFVAQLVQSKKLNAYEIAEFASHTFGFPLMDLNAIDPDHLLKGLLDASLIQKRQVLPLQQRGTKLFLAISDPTNLQALDDVKFQTGLTVEPVIVENDKLSKLVGKFVESSDTSMKDLVSEDFDDLDFIDEEAANNQAEVTGGEVDDAPVV